jgi:hypothetical protein
MSMNIPHTYGELETMTVDELRASYDERAPNVQAGVDFVLDELRRRESAQRESRSDRWEPPRMVFR